MRGLTKGYVLRRLGMFLLTIWLGATIVFIIPRLMPGDPVTALVGRMLAVAGNIENADKMIEAWRHKFGLDDPFLVQYFRYMGNLATGDLSYSLGNFPATVGEMIGRALPWTVGLLAVSTIFSFLIGNTVGALIGWRRTPRWLQNVLPVSLTFSSVPAFMLGMILIYIFAYGLHWFPPNQAYEGTESGLSLERILDIIHHAILPALAVVLVSMGGWALGMRGMMIT